MKLLICLLFMWSLAALAAAQNKPLDEGKFAVFSGGQQVGTETFKITSGEAGEGTVVLSLGATEVTLQTSLAYRGAAPLAYSLTQGPAKLDFAFDGGAYKLTGAQTATGQTDPRALILENNVWHHYYFAVARYDLKKGGAQQFQAFVPSIGQTLPFTIEHLGEADGAQMFQLKAFGGLVIQILTLPGGNVAYVGVPAQKAEAVREELASRREAIGLVFAAKISTPKPDYSAPPDAPFTAEEVVIKTNGYQLAGTLLLPKTGKRPFPAVVTITGSGQQTRDEPIPFPNLKNFRPFRQIAESLAARGIAVLRVDDRGVGASTGRETLSTATSKDFADDTRAQVTYLRARREIDPRRIALVGHSEGGSIAPMVAASDKQLAAVVLMAGPGKTGAAISLYQQRVVLNSQPNLSAEDKQKAVAQQEATIKAAISGGDLSKLPAEARLPWVREFWAYDPLPTMRRVRRPVLILQGALDQQITADQAALLEKAARAGGNKDVTARVFPKLNHFFLPCETGNFDEYAKLTAQELPADVVETLGAWLQKRLRASAR